MVQPQDIWADRMPWFSMIEHYNYYRNNYHVSVNNITYYRLNFNYSIVHNQLPRRFFFLTNTNIFRMVRKPF